MTTRRTARALIVGLLTGVLSATGWGMTNPHIAAAATVGTSYVVNTNANSITEYRALADGNVFPVRTIKKDANADLTGLARPFGAALDSAGTLYVANFDANSITEYAAGAYGNVAPIRTIKKDANPDLTGLSAPHGVTLDAAGTLYVANYNGDSITEYAAGASGNVPPIRTLTKDVNPDLTGLAQPADLALDAAGTLLVANAKNNSITGYVAGASGNVAPIRSIKKDANPDLTGLALPIGVTLDAAGTLYVANDFGNSITEYVAGANGNVAPIRTIRKDPNPAIPDVTGLAGPASVALDPAGTLYVANLDGQRITEYAAGVSGNVLPIRTIKDDRTGLDGPAGVVVADSSLAGVVGGDSALYRKQGDLPYQGLSGSLLAAPAVVSVPNAATGAPTPLFIGLGGDHRLYVRDGTSTWKRLITEDHQCFDSPAAVVVNSLSPPFFTLTVVCQGGDHALYYWTTPVVAGSLPSIDSSFQPLGGKVVAGPAVTTVSGAVTVFAEGTDHFLYSRTLADSSYNKLPAQCIGHPAAATFESTSYLACQGLDGGLYFSVNSGYGFTTFQGAGGQLIDGPGIAASSTGVAIFVEGTNEAMFHIVVNLDGSPMSFFTSDGGRIQHGAGATGVGEQDHLG